MLANKLIAIVLVDCCVDSGFVDTEVVTEDDAGNCLDVC